MAKGSSKQADLIGEAPAATDAVETAASIMKPLGWRREQRAEGITAWRKDDPSGDYFLIMAGSTTDVDPAKPIWEGGRYFDPPAAATILHPTEKRATLRETVQAVETFERLAPVPAFTAGEALRNLVLWHDGDGAFIAANRGVIADMPFGETSFDESLWQVARDICASSPPTKKETQS
jgi:hypothetical protein